MVIDHAGRILFMYLYSLQGDKNLIKFDGDHNSSRPQFYYDSVSIFFYNVLRPPQFPSSCSNKLEKYYNRGAGTNEVNFLFIRINSATKLPLCVMGIPKLSQLTCQFTRPFQSLLCEIINGLRAAGTDAGSSSAAATSFTNGLAKPP